MQPGDPELVIKGLRGRLRGELHSDTFTRRIYATDASLYEILPLAIAVPRDEEDVVAIIEFAAESRTPLLARGAGTSLAGQAVGPGIVIDFSKYLNRLLEISPEERWVRVEPGIVLDNLNSALAAYGLFFAPDVATSSRATIGGMAGNNASGLRSVRYGKTVDHVMEIRAWLSNLACLHFRETDLNETDRLGPLNGFEGELLRRIAGLIDGSRDLIISRFPKVMRRVSGYNLDELLDFSHFNLSRLMVGSEGTLGITTELKLHLEPLPRRRVLAVLHYSDLTAAIRSVPAILELSPSAVELLDRNTVELARGNPSSASMCAEFVAGNPEALLLVEFSGESEAETGSRLAELAACLPVQAQAYAFHTAVSPAEQQRIWAVRKSALGILAAAKGNFRPVPFIEDSCVPVEVLADYVLDIQELCRTKERSLTLYAHAGVGVLHMRPMLDLKQPEDVRILEEISAGAFDLVRKYHGSWSGEHGDGLARSYKLREFFGDDLYELFRRIKQLLDPAGIMNPGKIIDPPSPVENLRIGPDFRAGTLETYYRFEQEEGFSRAVELCTGVGQCRKTLSGVMCPSYAATLDEVHSTRGRANALRAAISGQFGPKGLVSPGLYDVLDLCLECKACKTECPTNVDMAKMKAEFLAHYQKEHGVPLAHRLVAMTRRSAEIGTWVPGVFNRITASSGFRLLLEKVAGFDRRRKLPRLAKETLTSWSKARSSRSAGVADVHIFVDTFTNYYEPSVGIAAVRLLEELGFKVALAEAGCCGRPLISAGLLARARRQGERVIRDLSASEGPIIVLEPTCFSTMRDDYLDLLGHPRLTREVVSRVVSLDEFLGRRENFDRLQQRAAWGPLRVLFHGHCQQRALIGTGDLSKVLSVLPGTKVEEVPAGCCGMAGAFGYQTRHYELSRKIGERYLLPLARSKQSDTAMIVPGFSCRTQLRDLAGCESLHPAQLLWEAVGNPAKD